jgi:integrase
LTQRFRDPDPITPFRAVQLLDLFLAKKENAGRRPHTLVAYRTVCERFIHHIGTPGNPAEWDDSHIDLYLAKLRRRGHAPATLAHHRRTLLVFIGWLADRGECADFRKRIESISVPQRPGRTATLDTLAAALLAISTSPYNQARNRAIVHALFSTGVRRSELAKLRYDDIDWSGRTFVVRAETAKTRTQRRCYMDPRTREAFLEWREIRGTHEGEFFGCSADAIRQMLADISARAGVAFSSHDFRRGFASRMLTEGLDPVFVAELGGWETLDMMRHYGRSTANDAALAAIRKLA